MMKMLTKANLAALPPLYSQEEKGLDAVARVKFFGGGRFTYYATEYDPDERRFFGYLLSPLGSDCDELCYMGLDELEALRFPPFGLPVERDLHFAPATVAEIIGDPTKR